MSLSRARGFSLVEMLAALFVFGLLATAGVAILASVADSRAAAAARMDRLAEFQRTRALLQSDLGQAALRRVRHPDGSATRNAFHGATSSQLRDEALLFAFVRRGWSNPDAAPRASLQYVEYRLSGGRLERSTRPALDGTRPGDATVLLDGIRAARVRYQSRGQWSDGWAGGATELPGAVELALDLEGLGEVTQRFLLPAVAP